MTWPLYLPPPPPGGKLTPRLLIKGLVGPQKQSGELVEENNFSPPPGIELHLFSCLARNPVAKKTTLTLLP